MNTQNKHQDDIMYITQVTRTVLITLGVWPSFNRRSAGEKIFKFLLVCATYILLYGGLIPGILFWCIEKRTHVRIRMIHSLLFGVAAVSKYSNLVFREEQIRRCLKHIEEDWRSVNSIKTRDTMINSAKTGRRLVALCGIFMYGSGLFFRCVLPFVKEKIVNAQNITIKPLPSPGYFFSLDSQISPAYEIIFVMQVLYGFTTFSITTGVCGLAAVFVMHACGQLRILTNLLKQLVDQKWHDKDIDKKLAEIVEHQIRIRK